MDSIIEYQRSLHEEQERVEKGIVKLLMGRAKKHRDLILREHLIYRFLNQIGDQSQKLLNYYSDEDKSRKVEFQKITLSDDFSEFYTRLKNIKDYHRRTPNAASDTAIATAEITRFNKEKELEKLSLLFSGEENFGKILDLHSIHDIYINLKGVEKVDYISFLDKVDDFEGIPKMTKATNAYKIFLDELQSYLEGFIHRIKPTLNIESLKANSMKVFDGLWESNKVPGWEADISTVPMSKELFCVPCQKQFAKKTVYDAHLSGKKHKKMEALSKDAPKSVEKLQIEKLSSIREKEKKIASQEFCITEFMKSLSTQRIDTKNLMERKQTLTLEEFQNLADEEDIEEEESEREESSDDEKFYNPLKLPIGWDGKPIPYWLYKLHGLDKEFPCEICGNFVYMGRKAFQKHFQEYRHAYGMRCLGIPNTPEFHGVVSIQDATNLWEKIQLKNREREFQPAIMEEFEDENGNVFNRQTFENLRRQGLI